MLCQGTSLEAIGAVLRHASIETTQGRIPKVDVDLLDQVVMPWLEVEAGYGKPWTITSPCAARPNSAVDWVAQAKTEVERHRRYHCLIGFARFIHAEKPCHEIPPGMSSAGTSHAQHPLFSRRRTPPAHLRRRSLGTARLVRPQTYKTLFTLLAIPGGHVGDTDRERHLRKGAGRFSVVLRPGDLR
jgi:hypothetical protein